MEGYGIRKRFPTALKCFDHDNPLAELLIPVQREKGDLLLEKQYSSSFFGTHLQSTLTGMGVDSLLICGFSTSGCVRATTVDAMQV